MQEEATGIIVNRWELVRLLLFRGAFWGCKRGRVVE